MALILSIESSTTLCSAALHNKGKLLCSLELHIAQSASSKLAVMVNHVINVSEVQKNQIEAIAVSEGPGSYTGLRIGVALAKGLCFSLGIPLIAINTLESMASQVKRNGIHGLLCPMIDARRMEVYSLLMDEHQQIVERTSAKVIDEDSFSSHVENGPVYFFGNGSDKCKAVINHPNAKFLNNVFPSAASMGDFAFGKFMNQQFENLTTFEPLYLKEFLVKKPKAIN